MIANNRKMNDLKNDIAYIMERERYISDMFSGHVEGGFIQGEDMIKDFIKAGKCPEVNDMITRLKKEDIMNNPYLRDIKITKSKVGNIELRNKRLIPANTIMLYKEKTRDLDTFMCVDSYLMCDRPLRFPGIIEADSQICWMTVEPSEIVSFQDFVDSAKGHVCLCGCGLGYVAYMLSLKEDVESITIVELNPDIIEMFKTHILPQFKNKDKINIVQGDAIEYLQTADLSGYDYIDVDIWRDTLDMLPLYLPCLVVEADYPSVNFSYWLEPTLKDLFRKSLLEQFSGYHNSRSMCFEYANVIAKDILDNTDIKTKQDLKDLIKLDDMRDVLRMWYLSHHQLSAEYQHKSADKMQEMMSFLNQVSGHEPAKTPGARMLNKLIGEKKL